MVSAGAKEIESEGQSCQGKQDLSENNSRRFLRVTIVCRRKWKRMEGVNVEVSQDEIQVLRSTETNGRHLW